MEVRQVALRDKNRSPLERERSAGFPDLVPKHCLLTPVAEKQIAAILRWQSLFVVANPLSTRPADLSWLLVLDAMIFQAEAEVRWLDHCEASLIRYTAPPALATTPAAATEEDAAAFGVEAEANRR